MKDVYVFQRHELDWLTIHYGSEPTEKSDQIRTVIYATYTPARMASVEQLRIKKVVFESFGGTTHWPHEQIVARPTQMFLPDGTRDARDRDQPREMPEMTDKLLKLAGAKPY
ncbi:uncharacterized protein PAC_17708 [Phialocephala subalpina]|uniref:Uncharacterized protein n=1 Tax=Phialocephala subalpina TaxID=576137 RepID=A0A1L7XS54_9HELO|nr:uncharacterized protein PAC_17708 [Phialocephala subalpina]